MMVWVRDLRISWCRGTELNRRRQPFQGCALPPELPRHTIAGKLQLSWRRLCSPTLPTCRDALPPELPRHDF